MKFRILYLVTKDDEAKIVDSVYTFSKDIDSEHLQDFYKIFEYKCSASGLQLCVMIPLNEDNTYDNNIFVTKHFQVFKEMDIRKWLSEQFKDYIPVYKDGVFQKLRKL